ncbi:YcnI family protein [Nocardia sp. CDC159]|uniref:YcnI family protein n=1 Tax=Nocardia pulmonis TaxID=2951408 RepID=A0A9X2EAZ7_9NOCA|nr:MULTISPECIES: YcnI family protein [Nocardia]MCM6776915.1 YcnI family protein [Nocardia pulmonis]MCM6789339.1 YcnI family protein [Nocardia sp. CDC159]
MSSVISRALVAAGATAGLAVLATGTAGAHVTADAPGASQGGYGVVTLRVPTESETAATTKLTVQLPNVSSARTEPMPGWSAKVDRNDKNQVTAVTWTAEPGNPGVGPGQFQRFVLSVGPLPKQEKVSLPAVQTYSDGKVVAWDQPMGPNGDEPEHPAPTLTLAASKGGDGHDAAAATEAGHHDSDDTARWLGGIGLGLGALGAALGLGSLIRSRRS